MSDLPTPPPPPVPSASPAPPIVDAPPVHDQEAMEELVPLERIPLPPFVLALAVITSLAFLLALVRFPHAVSNGIGFERAHRALASGKPAEAATLLEPIVKEFPKSKDARMDLVQAYFESQQNQKAARLLLTFEGESVSKEEEERLNGLMSGLQTRLHLDDIPAPTGKTEGAQ